MYDIIKELTESEKKVLEILRKLPQYGKIEISKNQDGSQLSVYITTTIKEVIKI